ncbi:MAG: type II toxin-antitoxin system RelE/ParE family toxin [Chitinispirillales bacterium]|jgi:mRNA-degrading endonuclease RelE of RelBE toxin-antitoxin system|nr:type II toxin-antitoxin system RelE/ParE family toxin [Chitinispirillales bacterium]
MDRYGILLSESFERDVKKLSEQDKKLVFDKIQILRNGQRYQTGKVRGRKDLYKTRVNDSIRLFWKYENDKLIVILRVGHHDIEKQRRLEKI